MIKFLIFIIIMGALVGFVWHDEIGVWLENWRKQAEEEGPGLINEGYQQAKNWWEEKGEAWADQFVANLTSQGKQRIDQWLAERNLNQYGDQQDTAYTGGTPLFNEQCTPAARRSLTNPPAKALTATFISCRSFRT